MWGIAHGMLRPIPRLSGAVQLSPNRSQGNEMNARKLRMGIGILAALGIGAFATAVDSKDVKFKDLVPKYNYQPNKDVNFPKAPPPKAKTPYQRFDSKVRRMRNSDGFGVGYDAKNRAPTATYKKSFP